MTSLEQNRKVNLARRIMRLFAPDFRIVARTDLEPGLGALDLFKRTIEVSEESSVEEALANILFSIGHLRLRAQGEFAAHFGEILHLSPEHAAQAAAEQGYLADIRANEWACRMLSQVFFLHTDSAEKLVSELTWDLSNWRNYYGLDDN